MISLKEIFRDEKSYLAQLMKVEVLLKEYGWNDATQEI